MDIEAGKTLTNEEVIRELLELLKKNAMKEQANDVFEICSYVDGLEKKIDSMTEELTNMQNQIKEMQEDTLVNNAKKALSEAQERLNARCEQIKSQVLEVKAQVKSTAKSIVDEAKAKGRAALYRVSEFLGIKKRLLDIRENVRGAIKTTDKDIAKTALLAKGFREAGQTVANAFRTFADKPEVDYSQKEQKHPITKAVLAPMKAVRKLFVSMELHLDASIDKLDNLAMNVQLDKEKHMDNAKEQEQTEPEREEAERVEAEIVYSPMVAEPLFVVIDLIFFICAFIYLTSGLIVAWKVKSPEHRYKGENLFFFGQIISKLNTTSKTMTLICITLVLAIFMFIATPILTGWALGYLDIRSMYDVQVYSRYNDVYEEENLPQNSYEIITDFLTEHKIDTDYDCTFNLYLPKKDDFHNRQKYDFPIVAISLSDYNTIREMLGYEQISLEEDEFTTQWKAIATEEERDNFLKEHTSIMTDAGELTLSGQSYYEDPIGETAYNSYTNVLYVLPDNICEKLLPVIKNRYITTTENISYENARKLEKLFTEKYPEQAETGAIYGVRFSTLQINSSIANNFILQTAMIYGAVVLMVICLTVLSLQQLLDAGQYKYRFSVLRKLGVEEKHIGKLILQQLSVWFGLPIITAIIVAAVVIAYFIQTISAEISAYIGFSALMLQIGATMGILAILLICYFISTWIIFRRSVNP